MESISLHNLCPALSTEEIKRIAHECRFSKRVEKKFCPRNISHFFVKNLSKVL